MSISYHAILIWNYLSKLICTNAFPVALLMMPFLSLDEFHQHALKIEDSTVYDVDQ